MQRSVSRGIVLILGALVALTGCQAGPRVTGRTIPPPSRQDCEVPNTLDELQSRGEVRTLVEDAQARQQIINETMAIIEGGSVGGISIRMSDLSNSLPDQVKREILEPLMQKCLSSEDPLIRWSGIYVANALEDRELVARSLAQDYTTLLIRPEPTPWWASAWWWEGNSWFNRLNAVPSGLRACLIELVGKYGTEEAKPVLLAIARDDYRWEGGAKLAAERALSILEGGEHNVAVREMLLRHVMAGREHVETWFIDYGQGKDPPSWFLERFSDLPVPVKGISQSFRDHGVAVRDRATGADGWIVYAHILRWIDDRSAEVEYGCSHRPEAGSGGRGIVRLRKGRWVLKETEGWES